jgi:hypothetical protein
MLGYGMFDRPNDITETANQIPKPPFIFPAIECDANGRCLEDNRTTGVTINNISDNNVIIPIQSGRVFMKFYAFADADQMPLRSIAVNWGDGFTDPVLGMFRNHRGYKAATCNVAAKQCEIKAIDDFKPCQNDTICGVGGKCIFQVPGSSIGKCLVPKLTGKTCSGNGDCEELVPLCKDPGDATTFGEIADKTCDNQYVQFTHVYQCTRLPKDQGGNFEPDAAKCGPRFPNGCCIFEPKVQVKDNWGWCTGKCVGVVGGDGCYDGFNIGRDDECRLKNDGAWIPFQHKVIVSPPPRIR